MDKELQEKLDREWAELTKDWKTYHFQVIIQENIKAPDEATARETLKETIRDEAVFHARRALLVQVLDGG